MSDGQLSFHDYGEMKIRDLLGDEKQARYLCSYLEEIGATSFLVEGHYVDRHFIDDFANYYARSFNAPVSYCSRLHFFSSKNASALESIFEQAFKSPAEVVKTEGRLQEIYLGFVVRRPLGGARIGRTVLKTYPEDGEKARRYEVVRDYTVHIAGLELSVRGLAYQQQDRGAAVCASTSLWSALQKVADVSGHRTPTPSEITAAAESPFPATDGLEDTQMARALSSLGYIADQFEPANNRSEFRAKVAACLESQLPVILMIEKEEETGGDDGTVTTHHAVTVTGFRDPKEIEDVRLANGVEPIAMRTGSLDILYVHDDNVGSHAHYELSDGREKDREGRYFTLVLKRGSSERKEPEWHKHDDWVVFGALVPKPAKMRQSVESLFLDLVQLRPVLEDAIPYRRFSYRLKFALGIDYKRKLLELDLDRGRLRGFITNLLLPRYVGLVEVSDESSGENKHLLDLVLDVTEVTRLPKFPTLLAIVAPGVAWNSLARLNLEVVKNDFDYVFENEFPEEVRVGLITGPNR